MSLRFEMASDPTQPIAEVVADWVYQECVGSIHDRNAYFDDFEAARHTLTLPFDDPANLQAAKHRSHEDRQRFWGQGLILEPENDFVAARQIFNVLMQMSGSSKRMCYFSATDQEDYLARKTDINAVGIDTTAAVEVAVSRYREGVDTFVVPDAEEVNALTLAEFSEKGRLIAWLQTRSPEDFGKDSSPTMDALVNEQERWAGLAATSILMAAGYREGDLAAVPILEPKSISDEPAILYPFAG